MLIQSMNLDLIRTFVIVGQSRDLTEAALKLKLDKSNISRHIKSLESLMGTKLFKKNSRNCIELTEDGKKLFDGYEKAYNLLFITEKSYRQEKDLNNGKITIGISSDNETLLLNKNIVKFKEKYPNTIFKIINLPSKELYDKLSHYAIDFVIDEKIDSQKSSGIVSYDVFTEQYCLCYLESKYSISNIKDLKEYPLILPVRSKEERNSFDTLLENEKINSKLSIETSNYISSLHFAKEGLGVALVPKRVAINNNLEVFDIDLHKNIVISYVEENLSPSSKEFLKYLKSKNI